MMDYATREILLCWQDCTISNPMIPDILDKENDRYCRTHRQWVKSGDLCGGTLASEHCRTCEGTGCYGECGCHMEALTALLLDMGHLCKRQGGEFEHTIGDMLEAAARRYESRPMGQWPEEAALAVSLTRFARSVKDGLGA